MLRKLNVYIALGAGITILGSFVLPTLLLLALAPLSEAFPAIWRHVHSISLGATLLIGVAVPMVMWSRFELISPISKGQSTSGLSRGEWIVAIGNISAIAGLAAGVGLQQESIQASNYFRTLQTITYVCMPICILLWCIGLISVFGSRERRNHKA